VWVRKHPNRYRKDQIYPLWIPVHGIFRGYHSTRKLFSVPISTAAWLFNIDQGVVLAGRPLAHRFRLAMTFFIMAAATTPGEFQAEENRSGTTASDCGKVWEWSE
jgi:hypothetical protein